MANDFTRKHAHMYGGNVKSHVIHVENLAAGGDIADRAVWRVPEDCTIRNAWVVGHAASAGIDGSNTSVFLLEVGSTAKVTVTYDDTNAFPDAETYEELATPTDRSLSKGDTLLLSITNGAAADLPALDIQIDYVLADSE